MTDEQLQKLIQDVSESLDQLSDPDKSLTKEERNRKQILLLKQETLCKIKEAREKNQKDQEILHTANYGLLTSLGEKHPYLMHLIKSNLRWSSF